MQYFVQLTPWSNLKSHRKKRHWGLLPTFDLNTPANVEAWNKLRLYLQSYKVKSSRILQISVMWCCLGVVSVSVYQLVKMTALRLNHVDPDCNLQQHKTDCNTLKGCSWDSHRIKPDTSCFMVPKSDESVCTSLKTCYWNSTDKNNPCQPNTTDTTEVFGGQTGCYPVICEVNPEKHPRQGLPRNYRECTSETISQDNCEWEPTLGCVPLESHFDTASMFMVAETLIFGSLLLSTLWGGMKSNEIKSEAFPYVIRMKQSELLRYSSITVIYITLYVVYRNKARKNSRLCIIVCSGNHVRVS